MNLQSVTQKRGVVSIRLYMLQKGVEELLISIFYMYIKIDMPSAREKSPLPLIATCLLPLHLQNTSCQYFGDMTYIRIYRYMEN